MAKQTVYEVYVELLIGSDFTATSEASKSTAYQLAKSIVTNGFVDENVTEKRTTFIPVHEIKRVIVQERSLDVPDGK